MNDKPIAESADPDLRRLDAALRRAGQRARDLARATNTRLVLSRDGKICYVTPEPPPAAEPEGAYGKRNERL